MLINGTNHLAGQKSPYLIQHLRNPVDWYPWGDEAFDKARREDRPVFLSIGYSTCHWCHVMERESFEDADTARLINDTFVPVKVDREERPDIDRVYMTACQMMTGSGGWPLTIIMTPDRKPFFAGTYLPRESGHGRTGLMELTARVAEIWKDRRADALDTAERIAAALRGPAVDEYAGAGVIPAGELSDRAFENFSLMYDPENGGFGAAPKFPSPHNLMFLLRYWRSTGKPEALDMAVNTLRKMRLGGIWDHAGFGFHRYSTDGKWLVPHFEKMLYDQALLAMAYVEAFQATGDALFERTAREIFEYVLRDMTSPEGAFYSAEDADSEGREGAFYLWTGRELLEALGADTAFAVGAFNVNGEGNFRDEAMGRATGENILYLSGSPGDGERLERVRTRLFEARGRRSRPLRDDKVLADWNGLMIAALAKGAAALDDGRYLLAAERAAGFVMETMLGNDGRLLHRYRDGEASIKGNLDDYAFFVWGLLELYGASFKSEYLERARLLARSMLEHFSHPSGGLRYSPADGEELIAGTMEFYDGAVPSGNAVAHYDCVRLARLTGDPALEERASRIARAAAGGLGSRPHGHAALLIGLQLAEGESCEIVLAGDRDDAVIKEMTRALRARFLPHCVVLAKRKGDDIARPAPFTVELEAPAGGAAAYVCRNRRCLPPASSAAELLESIKNT